MTLTPEMELVPRVQRKPEEGTGWERGPTETRRALPESVGAPQRPQESVGATTGVQSLKDPTRSRRTEECCAAQAADRGRPWGLDMKLLGSKWLLNRQSDGQLQTALEHNDPRLLSASGTNPSFCFTAKHCLKSPHSFVSLHIPKSRISPMLRLFLVDSPVAALLNRPK